MTKLQDFLHAISDEKRIRILKMLEKRPVCICQITAVLGIRQPTVSKHMSKLKKANIVIEQRTGQFILYMLNKSNPFINIWWVTSNLIDSNIIMKDEKCLKEFTRKVPLKIDSQSSINQENQW
ncbi:MAG TPA: metalloregulator ArsR/SmtB family transcription factor [bacterium]|nr:metalloregulator ArsR/SmtB family transcription factor [bacterium]HPO52239.1 metalloregulator ArsR/SmtB family transcription factor [bacterium]